MVAIVKKVLMGTALLIIISGSAMAPNSQEILQECDGYTCATPPVKPAKRDSTQNKKKKTKKAKKQSTKTKTETNKQQQ